MTTKTAPKSGTVSVTPDMAREMLENGAANRRIIQSHVTDLAKDMKNGQWIEHAGDPLRFDNNDALIDGQHRLWAILESGVTIRFIVIKGLDPSTMDILDIGKRRSLKDFLEIKGEINSVELAATINLLRNYWATEEIVNNAWGLRPVRIHEAVAILKEHPGIRDAVQYAHSRRILGNRSRWAAMHFIFAEIDQDDATFFVDRVHSGIELPKESPIMLLRTRLLADQHSLQRMRVREYCALSIKAWNYYRKGELSHQVLAWRSGGSSPEAYPIPI